MIVVDSCVWDYYLDPTTKEHKFVKDELEGIIRTEEILTNTIIWVEVAHYLYKISRLPRETLEQKIKNFTRLSTMEVIDLNLNLFYHTLKILSEMQAYPVGGRDATILAMMRRRGVRKIFTHDKGFKELAKHGILEVIDPIPEDK
jgi:predicted nucleic acid-binding protein